jgi:Flp pilus assembly protein CpaB
MRVFPDHRPLAQLAFPSVRLRASLMLVAAFALATTTGLLIYLGLQQGREQIVASSQQPVVVGRVVVAGADIPAGTLLTSDAVPSRFEIARERVEQIPADVISSLESLEGRTTAVQIRAGDHIRASDLVPLSATTAAGARTDLLPPGYVAIVLPANDQISVGGAVVPADRVDLIASVPLSDGVGNGVVVTQALLRDVRVVATGFRTRSAASPAASINPETAPPAPYATLTLALTPQDALVVEHLLATNVRLSLALRRPTDDLEPTSPVTTSELARRFGLSAKS